MKKQRIFLSVLSALLLSVSWPAQGFPFFILVAFVPLFYLEEDIARSEKKQLFLVWFYSYISAFIWNLLTTWWIWNSTDFGAIMAILLNSLFMSWVWVLFSWSKTYFYNSKNAIFLFPVYWLAFEYLHLDWDLSWSWLNLGNAFANYPQIIQWYEWTGSFGGSLWIIVFNILIFRIISKFFELENIKHFRYIRAIILLVFGLSPLFYSLYRYQNYEEKGEDVEIVVVQPNMDPWSEQFMSPPEEVINRMIDLSKPLISEQTKFWIAPESAIQEGLKEPELTSRYGTSSSVSQLQEFLKSYPDLNMIVGASTWNYVQTPTSTCRKTSSGRCYDEYNTAILLNSQEALDFYHKSKLVPGPEKMPFQKLLRPLQEFAFDLGGTVGSLGFDKERKVFYDHDQHIGIAPLICYESIYGEFVSEFVKNGAHILAIITNDGWWGNTAGHRQHFAYARIRAIENRRAVARSANTGISGFINQRGDLIETTPYWIKDARKANIKANQEMTFYTKEGDYLGRISTFLSVLFALISLSIYLKKRKKLRTE